MLGNNLTVLVSKTFSDISETILIVRVMILPCSINIINYHGTEFIAGSDFCSA